MPAIKHKIAGILVPKLFILSAPAPNKTRAATKFIIMQNLSGFIMLGPFLKVIDLALALRKILALLPALPGFSQKNFFVAYRTNMGFCRAMKNAEGTFVFHSIALF